MKKTKILPLDHEPKRICNFRLEFPENIGIESWMVTEAEKPKYLHDKIWDDLKITLIDTVGPSASQKLFKFVNAKKSYKKSIYHHQSLDPTGKVVQDWEIKVTDVYNINFGGTDVYPILEGMEPISSKNAKETISFLSFYVQVESAKLIY